MQTTVTGAALLIVAAWVYAGYEWLLDNYDGASLRELSAAVGMGSVVAVIVLGGLRRSHEMVDAATMPSAVARHDTVPSRSKTSLREYTEKLKICAHQGDIEGALQRLESIEKDGYKPDRAVYTCMVNACAHARQPNTAVEWLQKMQQEGFVADAVAYTAVIHAYANCGHSSDADHWLSVMQDQGMDPTSRTFEIMLNAYAKDSGKVDDAVCKLVKKMNSVGVEPTVVMFNTIINDCAQRGSVVEALDWLELMDVAGVSPNSVTYNAVLKACAKSGSLKQAESVLNKMKAGGLQCDSWTYNAMINASAHAKRPSAAVMWLNAMRDAGVEATLHSYTSLILAFAHVGETEQACFWLNSARQSGITPDKFTFTTVLKAYVAASDIVGAYQVLDEMVATGVTPDVVTYTILANGYVSVGQPEKATKCCQLMQKRGHGEPSIVTFATLMRGYARTGVLKQVEQLHQEILDMRIQPNQHTYLQLLVACQRAHKPDRAIFWFKDMQANNVQANQKIIQNFSRCVGQPADAILKVVLTGDNRSAAHARGHTKGHSHRNDKHKCSSAGKNTLPCPKATMAPGKSGIYMQLKKHPTQCPKVDSNPFGVLHSEDDSDGSQDE